MAGWLSLGGGAQTQKPIRYSGLNVSSSRMDLPVPIFWGQRRLSPNAIWYNNFQKHAVNGGGSKGKGGGGKGSNNQYDYTAATIMALCEGIVDDIVNVWAQGSTTTVTSLTALNMTLFTGTAAQAPWAYTATNYPAESRSYGLTAYLACPQMDLGSSATIPDNAFEAVRANSFSYTHTSDGWIDPSTHIATPAIDVLLSDVIPDLLTNAQYGLGFSSGDIGSTAQYASYLRAQGLFFSPLLNAQEKTTEVLNRWAQLSNTWIYWSGAQLQFVPLGDSAVTGNGVTYTPDNAVAYNLGFGDFLGDVPVSVNRVDPADCYNRTVVQITDRTIGYISNPIEFKDQTLVDQYGLRDSSSTQADEICDPAVGAVVAQLIGKRAAYLRNTYKFKTSYRYIRCLPGTVLTLTDANIGIAALRVRVRTIEEDDDGNLSFLAEELPGLIGTYSSTGSGVAGAPTTPNTNVLPGNINTPAILEPDASFTNGVPRIVVAASGGADWGGCDVFISFDGTSYSNIGRITAAAIQGVLTAPLANHADPDTVNTLSIDCTESLGVPVPVTTDDADALRTASFITTQPTPSGGGFVVSDVGEILAFGDVNATGTYSADLTYLRRGYYGFPASAHSIGDQFTLLDVLGTTGTSVVYDLPPQYIGQLVYIKFASFNSFGFASQDLSTVDEYQYTPTGLGYGMGTDGVPSTPTGLTATGGSGQNFVEWNSNPVIDGVTSYDLYIATGSGASFGSAVLSWSGLATNFTHTGLAASAAYTYFLIAQNVIGPSTHTAGVSATSSAPVSSIALTNSHILVGNSSNVAADVPMSGDATIANTGAITVAKSGGVAFGSAAFASTAAFDAAGAGTAAVNAKLIPPCTVAALPSPTLGLRGMATDASVAYTGANIGTVVAGSGANKVPVYADGSNWLIG